MQISNIIILVAFVAYSSVHAAPDLSLYPYLGSVPFQCAGPKDWVIQTGIGSNNVNYPMRIDTSTNVTWVAGTNCTTGDFCTQHRSQEYNPALSFTALNRNFQESHNFDPGQSISADVYNDELYIGPLEYVSQPLDVAFTVNGFQNVDFVGSIGFGGSLVNTTIRSPRYSSNSTISTTARRKKRQAGSESTNDSSMSGHAPTPAAWSRKRAPGESCQFFYGYNPSFISGDIAWFDLAMCPCGSPEFWRIYLHSVNVGNVIAFYNLPTTVASFDTSVDYILAPKYYIDQIHTAFNAQQNPATGNFEFSCRGLEALTFTFAGYNVSIPAAAWAVQNGNTCYLKLGENQGQLPTEWRLGRVFMRLLTHLYSRDTKQVGLAHPSQDIVAGIQITPNNVV